MVLTFGAAAAALQTYLTWGREHAYAVFLFALIAFAMASIIFAVFIYIFERRRIKGRIKVQQIVPHIVEKVDDKLALSPRVRIVNRSHVTVAWVLKHVHLQFEANSAPQNHLKEVENITLPNDHGWVIISTITNIPFRPQNKGTYISTSITALKGKPHNTEWNTRRMSIWPLLAKTC